MIQWQTKNVLITVKAYPNPSKKYVETVCVAGIDLAENKWIRLYPVPFRDLDGSKKFKKYNIIKLNVTKPTDDKRPESYKIDPDSITLIDFLDTKDGWNKRKSLVIPTKSDSMCEILRRSESEDLSLGVFKPKNIEFYSKRAVLKNTETREACYAQLGFFDKNKNIIEPIPYEFRYKFRCENEPTCPVHDFMIIDWEIGQAYRDWRKIYKTETLLLEKIKERWLNLICSPKNDVYFYTGNTKRFRDTFMILGVFYPPK